MSHTYEFNITMTCGGCSGAVDRVLKKLEGMGPDMDDPLDTLWLTMSLSQELRATMFPLTTRPPKSSPPVCHIRPSLRRLQRPARR